MTKLKPERVIWFDGCTLGIGFGRIVRGPHSVWSMSLLVSLLVDKIQKTEDIGTHAMDMGKHLMTTLL